MSADRVIGDRYEIGDLGRDLLGRGGMGDVYRGRDAQTGQMVAVKALRPEVMVSDPDAVARFAREGEALRQLNHPNIVKLVDALQEGGRHYLIVEYVAGGSLRDLLEEQGRLPIGRTIEIGLDLADALTRAHRLGIVHRDVKPSNVLLAEDGTPRLTDFGMAHLADRPRLTQTGTVVGTFLYLSPEACRGEVLDARADIWAFGALLYEMLTGCAPFGGETVPAVFMAILSQPVPDLSQMRPDVPDALADLIYRMLEKERRQRVPSVRAVGAELEAILAAVSGQRWAVSDRPQPATSRFVTPTPPADVRHNLPAQTTPFVGRESELESLAGLIDDPDVRLVTLLGPGGMGKTRLALEAAAAQVAEGRGERFADGVFFVGLAPLGSAEQIVPTVAKALNLQFHPRGEPKRQLLDYLRDKRMLLLMDNYEHLLDGVGIVSEILQAAPRVQVLATSRERLNLSGETAFVLAGIAFPDWETPEDALEYSAVRLYVQSARRARPGYELQAEDVGYVARICRLVEGVPLAILLAAAWVEVLTTEEIAAEVGRGFDFLESEARDMPERQRSLRAVFESSWRRLSEREREAFAKLSVFRGGFAREAGQVVAGAGLRTLMALTNKSLLHRGAMGRYEIHEMLRQYAGEKLDERAAESERALDLHCAYYAEFLQRRETDLWKGYYQGALTEIDNVRGAWRWATARRKVVEIRECLPSLLYLWERLGLLQEGEAIFAEAVDALRARRGEEADEEREAALGLALMAQAFFSRLLGHAGMVQELGQESLSIQRRLGARREVAFCYVSAVPFGIPKDSSEARQLLEEGLAISRKLDYLPGLLAALSQLGHQALYQGAHREAEEYYQEVLRVSRRTNNRTMTAFALVNLGHSARERGEYGRARQCFEESLALYREIGQTWAIGRLYSHLGDVALAVSDYEESRERHQRALAVYRDLGVRWAEVPLSRGGCWGVPVSLQTLGDVALATGEDREAKKRYRRALEMAIDDPHLELQLQLLLGPARLCAQEGKVDRAVEVATLARHHPASVEETREKAGALLDELRARLPPDAYAAAVERGRILDLEETMAELLAELGGK